TPYRRPSAGATFPHRCAPGDYSLDGGEIPGELSERRNRRGDLGGGGFDWRVGCVWCRREDSNLHGAINPTRSLVSIGCAPCGTPTRVADECERGRRRHSYARGCNTAARPLLDDVS